jgi:hypothetical protein
VRGTHNSYKQAMPAQTMRKLLEVAPADARSLDYGHRPLPEQLDAGVRQLEIDVYHPPVVRRSPGPPAADADVQCEG